MKATEQITIGDCAKLQQENTALRKIVEYLVEKPFYDCFQYICDSPNECQTFGCKVQKYIKSKQQQ